MSSIKNLSFRTDAERKQYELGMAEVQRKLAGHRRPTAQGIHERSMLEGRVTVAVVKKMSALLKDGVPVAPARASASTITVKAPRPAAPARGVKTYHRYECRQWLAPV